jgi:Ca2+-binding EF-hand superfamily protein
MIKESDEFGSGEISFEEFIEFMVTKITKKSNSDPILKEVFDYFVGENSGLMGPEQLKQMMNDNGEKLTAAELVQMMDEASIIDEGSINYKDFIRPIDFPEDDI